MPKVLEQVFDWIAGAKTAIAKVVETAAGLDKERDDALTERQRLIGGQRPTKKEVFKALDLRIREQGERWAYHHVPDLVNALAGRIAVSPSGAIQGISYDATVTETLGLLEFPFWCAVCPSVVRDGFRRLIEEDTRKLVVDDGPSLTQRIELIGKLDGVLRELETQHAALVDQAVAGGVKLDHWPEEVGRRTTKAQERERWELDQRANAGVYRRHPHLKPAEPQS